MRWHHIEWLIKTREHEIEKLREEWTRLKDECLHPQLPKRELGEEYRDVCPDCGFMSYCYAL